MRERGREINSEMTVWCSYSINGRDKRGKGRGEANKVIDGGGKQRDERKGDTDRDGGWDDVHHNKKRKGGKLPNTEESR